jgi:CheY-like chemotaxis protein
VRGFERSDYAVAGAADRQAALEPMAQGLRPDVVVTDLEMPRLDGLQLVRTLTDLDRLSDVPGLIDSGATPRASRAST